jgi:AcrR family transcriptional regulator
MSPRRAQAVRGRSGQDPGTALREHLVDTAEQLLAERQVSTVTTRDIARAAGVSDGVLYNYFTDKYELIVAALVRRYSGLMTRFDTGLPVPGTGTVEENLTAYAVASLELVAETLPVASGLLSEPELLNRFIAAIHQEPFGPHRLRQPISDYITTEQRLGRLGDFDVEAAVALVMGPAIMLGFTELMSGTPRTELTERFRQIVHTLLTGLLPR